MRDPVTGRLYIATKNVFGGALYAVPEQLERDRDQPAAAGRRGCCRSPPTARSSPTDGTWSCATTRRRRSTPGRRCSRSARSTCPDQRQGEGIAVAPDGTLYLSSEGLARAGARDARAGRGPARRWRRAASRSPPTLALVRRPRHRRRDPVRRPDRRVVPRRLALGWPVGCSPSSRCVVLLPRPAPALGRTAAPPSGEEAAGAGWLAWRHGAAAAELTRRPGLDPPPRRQGVRLPRRGRRRGSSADDVERVKGLVIPPAWRDVWICPWPNGHLQAVGTDDAGRRQYLYHPDWRTQRDAREARAGAGVRPGAVEGPRAGAGRPRHRGDEPGPRLRGRRTAARPRLLPDRQRRVRRGERQLRAHHPRSGSTCASRARRWSSTSSASPGSSTASPSTTPATVEALEVMRRRRGPADERAAGVEGRPAAGATSTPAHVNDYVRRTTGIEATAKDFRTWHATVIAAAALAETRRARRHQGLAQAGRGGGDEGGRGVPREHPGAGALVVRRPARGGRLRGGQHDRGGDAAEGAGPRTSGRPPSSAPCCGCWKE